MDFPLQDAELTAAVVLPTEFAARDEVEALRARLDEAAAALVLPGASRASRTARARLGSTVACEESWSSWADEARRSRDLAVL